jgi:hypothetical protein
MTDSGGRDSLVRVPAELRDLARYLLDRLVADAAREIREPESAQEQQARRTREPGSHPATPR